MRILIDADGCPVVDITIQAAEKKGLACYILCDTSHFFERKGATTLTFSNGADSVDFALVNLLKKGDIVVTQDYGLAAMCLARNAFPISQNGMWYTPDNIDSLLSSRHTASKIRKAGGKLGRIKGPAKRTAEQDESFKESLDKLINKYKSGN